MYFRAVYVFDQMDTEGKPLSDLGSAQGDPSGYTEKLKQFIEERGIPARILRQYLSSAGAVLAWKDRAPARPDCGGGVRHFGP